MPGTGHVTFISTHPFVGTWNQARFARAESSSGEDQHGADAPCCDETLVRVPSRVRP